MLLRVERPLAAAWVWRLTPGYCLGRKTKLPNFIQKNMEFLKIQKSIPFYRKAYRRSSFIFYYTLPLKSIYFSFVFIHSHKSKHSQMAEKRTLKRYSFSGHAESNRGLRPNGFRVARNASGHEVVALCVQRRRRPAGPFVQDGLAPDVQR
jgi:hypothetical protein